MYRADNEPVSFTRDVDAVIVPAGVNVKLRLGQQGYITQALGGSFTVYVEGNLFRIAGQGRGRARQGAGRDAGMPPDASDDDVQASGLAADERLLRPGDPDQHRRARPGVRVRVVPDGDGRGLSIKMTLTAPGCGMGDVLVDDVRRRSSHPDREQADVELVFDPPWDQSMMSEAARLQTG